MTQNEVVQHLLRMGAGNHGDNVRVLEQFTHVFLTELSEQEFLDLVFLQTSPLEMICPRGADRRLKAVATRALTISQPRLGANWDLDDVRQRTEDALRFAQGFQALLLREAKHSELNHGIWYLQDGSHRALGYSIAFLGGRISYTAVTAYVCTSQTFREFA